MGIRKKRWDLKRVVKQIVGCKNSPTSAPLFVHRTHIGTLAIKLREMETDYNSYSKKKVKIVEEGMATLAILLVKTDPW